MAKGAEIMRLLKRASVFICLGLIFTLARPAKANQLDFLKKDAVWVRYPTFNGNVKTTRGTLVPAQVRVMQNEHSGIITGNYLVHYQDPSGTLRKQPIPLHQVEEIRWLLKGFDKKSAWKIERTSGGVSPGIFSGPVILLSPPDDVDNNQTTELKLIFELLDFEGPSELNFPERPVQYTYAPSHKDVDFQFQAKGKRLTLSQPAVGEFSFTLPEKLNSQRFAIDTKDRLSPVYVIQYVGEKAILIGPEHIAAFYRGEHSQISYYEIPKLALRELGAKEHQKTLTNHFSYPSIIDDAHILATRISCKDVLEKANLPSPPSP